MLGQVLLALALALNWAELGCGEPRRTVPPGASAPLFSDLGDHHLAITTREPLAQRYFDQGLILAYGFNHAEAVRSFREAQRLDPSCAACFWGEAYALGPNINRAMKPGQLLAIADRVLAARIASERGALEDALSALREAVALQDALPYSEPPAWYFPIRDALGQALLDAGQPAEGEAVFREQLSRAPGSGWTLYGLAESLRAQQRASEANEVSARFDEAWRQADFSLTRAVF